MSRGPNKILSPLNGGTGITAKPAVIGTLIGTSTATATGAVTVAKGMLESPPLDVGDAFNINVQVDIQKTDTPVATATMPAGSAQLEASSDGNAWVVMGTPAPVATTTERVVHLPLANTSHRYYKSRFIPTGGVTCVGTVQTMGGTVPGAAVRALAFTPDGVAVAASVGTAVNFNVWPFAQTTTSLGTAVTATVSGGTPAIGALEFNPNIATKYYALMGGGTTPYASIQPLTLGTLAAGTEIPLTALAGACLDVDWHPSGQFLVAGHTTTPFVQLHHFDPVTGILGAAQFCKVVPAVGNVTCVKFSPDGNWLLIGGGTSPYVEVRPVTYSISEKVITIGTALPAPTTLPGGATLRGAWHPTGNRFIVVRSNTAVTEYAFYRKNVYIGTTLVNVGDHCSRIVSGNDGAIGPPIPLSAAAVAPINVRYSPDGSHIVYCTGTTPFNDIYPLKDMGTANNVRHTSLAALASATSYNDFRWSPNMQYVIMGGPGGTAFQQVFPWILPVQMGTSWSRNP